MKITWRSLSKLQAQRGLFRELAGRVFHITSVGRMLEILQVGEVRHNLDGSLRANGKYNAYFRNRGCVSFCDFHNNTRPRKVREAALTKYDIFGQGDGERFAYLFLQPESFPKLVQWSAWKRERAFSEMVVPHLESGYPGFVPLNAIEEICLVHVRRRTGEHKGIAEFLEAGRRARSLEGQSSAILKV